MGEGKPQASSAPTDSQAKDNVPQEAAVTNENWDTGTPKDPGQGAKDGYWNEVSDENAETDAGTATGGQ
jgi:hypothetical protein